MQPFTRLTAIAVPIDLPNVDTDRIIPARFLRRDKDVPEYASFLSQFRTGKVWDGGRVKGEDVPQIAQDLPNVNIYRGSFGNGVPNIIFMTEPNSPWLDVRRRHAVSMAINRDLLAHVASGADQLAKSGLTIKPVINGFLGAGWGGFTLEPRSKEIGDGAASPAALAGGTAPRW